MYKSEAEMSFQFEEYLQMNYGDSYFKEYDGLFGRPDFVYYNKYKNETSITSFELKLRDWRRAIKQAFRYRSFSNIAYVVLPESNINPALNNLEMFEQFNIGLASFDEAGLKILYKPESKEPYSVRLSRIICSDIESNGIDSVKKVMFS